MNRDAELSAFERLGELDQLRFCALKYALEASGVAHKVSAQIAFILTAEIDDEKDIGMAEIKLLACHFSAEVNNAPFLDASGTSGPLGPVVA